MNLPNLLAVTFVVAGIGIVLFAFLVFATPLILGPETLIRIFEMTEPILGPSPGTPEIDWMLTDHPVLFAVAGSCFIAVPGLLSIGIGVALWAMIGRPRHAAELASAGRKAVGETAYQALQRRCVDHAGEDELARARVALEIAQGAADLDPHRRQRLGFVAEACGIAPHGSAGPSPIENPIGPEHATPARHHLGRVVAVLLLGIALFLSLWCLLVWVFGIHSMGYLGVPMTRFQFFVFMLPGWTLALILVAEAAGIRWMAGLDREIEAARSAADRDAADRIVEGFHACLHRLPSSVRDAPALPRALALASLLGLARERKRALVEHAIEARVLGLDLDLGGADLAGADLSGLDLAGFRLARARLTASDLRFADLSGADLCRADLCWADLREADLREADLRGSNLWSAKLQRAELAGADLSAANLEGASLWGADLTSARLERARISSDQLRLAGVDPAGAAASA